MSSAHPKNAPSPRRALIVDDFPSVQFYHSAILQKAGFTCRSAPNGQAAIDSLKQEPAELVVLDLVMPEMNGQEFISTLHAHPFRATTPVLIISSEHIGERIRRARTARTGPVGFILKPTRPDKILEEIDRLLHA